MTEGRHDATKSLNPNTPIALGLVATLLLVAFNIGDRWGAQREQERRIQTIEAKFDSLEDKVEELTNAVTTHTSEMGHLLEGMKSLEQTIKEPPRRQR